MMHNNLVYVTGEGLVDAAEINGVRWSQLCAANTPSTKQKLVKCAWCWDEHREAHWMKTFDREGSRVVSHQPGAGIADHPYEALETPQHRAWNYRAARVGAEAGYGVEVESWSADKKTRADVLLVGELTVAYEHQHSPFKKGRGALERTRLAKAAGRDEVMWHGTNELIVGRARVPMLLSADLP
ncbi:MAG TPA: hypothetical protein VFH77_09290, partial [Streptomyces sp.]|nr:hypothetical protein [Streptomyces sp.]